MTSMPTKHDSHTDKIIPTENTPSPTEKQSGHSSVKHFSLTFLSVFIAVLFATSVICAVVSHTSKTDLPQRKKYPPNQKESLFIGNLHFTDTYTDTDTEYIQTEESGISTDTISNVIEDTQNEPPFTDEPPKKQNVILKVNNILQNPELPNGCEAASLAILLSHYGYSISPLELYNKYMPKVPYKSGNPWYYYVGDATGLGYGCYAPCLVTTGNDYLASKGADLKVINVSGYSFEHYERYIDRGIPVIIWGTIDMNCNGKLCWEAIFNGQYVNWHAYSHCLVLIGYTESTYVFCDPLVGITEYDKSSVAESFNIMYKQACIIE